MSIYIMSRVWQQSKSRNGDRLVLLAIADFADEKARAFPSMASLSAKSNMDVRSVQRSVSRLVEMGELAVREGAGPHGVNVYYVLLPESPAQPATVADMEIPPAATIPDTPPANCHPRQIAPPAFDTPPPANDPFTPGILPPNPSKNHSLCEREDFARTVLAASAEPETPVQTPPKPRADPLEHLQRPTGWPPALGLGELDEPIAEMYQAYRSARFPAKASTTLLPGEIRKDVPTLQEMHAAGITPAKVFEATQRALLAWSSRERVTLAAVAAHWSSLMDDAPPPTSALKPMSQSAVASPKRRRITPDEARESVRRGLNKVLTEGDGF
jgi:hypothetical protein